MQPLIDVKLLQKYQKHVAMYLDHGCGGLIGSTSAVAHIIVRRHLLQLIFDLIVHLQGVYKCVDSP